MVKWRLCYTTRCMQALINCDCVCGGLLPLQALLYNTCFALRAGVWRITAAHKHTHTHTQPSLDYRPPAPLCLFLKSYLSFLLAPSCCHTVSDSVFVCLAETLGSISGFVFSSFLCPQSIWLKPCVSVHKVRVGGSVWPRDLRTFKNRELGRASNVKFVLLLCEITQLSNGNWIKMHLCKYKASCFCLSCWIKHQIQNWITELLTVWYSFLCFCPCSPLTGCRQ